MQQLMYNSKTDGLEEETVENPIIYGDHMPLLRALQWDWPL